MNESDDDEAEDEYGGEGRNFKGFFHGGFGDHEESYGEEQDERHQDIDYFHVEIQEEIETEGDESIQCRRRVPRVQGRLIDFENGHDGDEHDERGDDALFCQLHHVVSVDKHGEHVDDEHECQIKG